MQKKKCKKKIVNNISSNRIKHSFNETIEQTRKRYRRDSQTHIQHDVEVISSYTHKPL